MDFTRKIRIKTERRPEISNLETLYPLNVLLYDKYPTQTITVESFEELAIDRLKVLRIIDLANEKGFKYLSTEWKEAIINDLKQQKLKNYLRIIQGGGSGNKTTEIDLLARQSDYISHFLLRLAYSRSYDLKKWFINKELDLFRLKFSHLLPGEIKQFLEVNNLKYMPISEEEKAEIKDGLYESTFGQSNYKIEMLDFYKVEFLEVIELVKARRCYIKGSYAYVNVNDFISIVATKLQELIERGLERVTLLLPGIESDERISNLIKSLHTSYTGKDYTVAKGDTTSIESIDQLSKKSFPLCMRSCHETLREKHHHKHGGRMQYGLFLKGINVTLEDSLRFWQEEFCHNITPEDFNKQYRYNIRHNYGKEGSGVNYTPYSCIKIIQTYVGPNESHGCPFKTLEPHVLRAKISSYGISAAHTQDIVNLATKQHHQLACGKYFEAMHNTKLNEGINHPNQFFSLSQAVQEQRQSSSTSKNISTTTTIRPQSKQIRKTDDDELWDLVDEQNQTQCDNEISNINMEDDFDYSCIEDDF